MVRGLAVVAVLGALTGCPPDKPKPKPEPTIEEQVEEKLDAAKVALKDGDLAKATAECEAANELKADSAKDMLAKIQAAKDKEDAEAREKRLQAAIMEAQNLLAMKDLDGAAKKAEEVLAEDADNAEARKVLEDVAAARQPDTKADYEATNAQIDAAVKAGEWAKAIDLVKKLETFVDEPNGLTSRSPEVPGFEANILDAEGEALLKRGKLADAVKKYEAAVRKNATPARRKALADAKAMEAEKDQEIAKDKRYNKSMRDGTRLASAGKLPEAIRAFRDAVQNATDDAKRSRAEAKIAETQRELKYRTAMDAGDKAMALGDAATAIARYEEARGEKRTPQVEIKLKEASAVQCEADGEKAAAAKDWVTAIAKYKEAIDARPSAGLQKKLEEATAAQERVDYLAKIEEFRAAQKADKLIPVVAELRALAEKYPQWGEAGALLKKGPSGQEKKKSAKMAAKAWSDAQKKLKDKKICKGAADRIKVIEDVLPQLAYSKQESTATKQLKREKDGVLEGKYKQEVTVPLADKKRKLTGQAKVDHLKGVLDGYKGSGHYDKIKDMIKAELDKIKQGDFNKLLGALKPLAKKPDAQLDELKRSLPDFAGTKFESQIKDKIYTALMAMLKKEKNPNKKIELLEKELGLFAGHKRESALRNTLKKEKTNLVKNLYRDVKRVAGKKKTATEKVQYLRDQLPDFTGTKYAKLIERDITATQKKIDDANAKAKDAAAKKVYDKAKAETKKTKDNAKKIEILTEAVQQVAGTKYVDMLNKEIKKLQPKPKKTPKGK
jgi:hypothetical protein